MDLAPEFNIPYEQFDGQYVLGIEGSANKIGIGISSLYAGIVDFKGNIYSNPR